MLDRAIAYLLIFAFASSLYTSGAAVGPVTVTPTSFCLSIAAFLTAINRLMNGLPIFPIKILKIPAVWSCMLYFGIGLVSYVGAIDKLSFYREVVQRIAIIVIPFYACSMGLRRLEDAKRILLWYIPGCTFLSFAASKAAHSTGFDSPVYLWGLHKNMTAGLCATLSIIAIAHLFTSRRPKFKLGPLQLPNKPLFALIAGLGFMGIIAAQGRAGVIEIGVGTLIILLFCRVKPLTVAKLTAAGMALLYAVYRALPEKAVEHVTDTKQHSANNNRILIWSEMWNNLISNPLLMTGWGNGFYDSHGYYYYDTICVLFFDWYQMSVIGAAALLVMMFASVKLGFDNARMIKNHQSPEGFVNAASTAIVAAKFVHGMLDTFWIGRGHTFHTWMCIGICLFIQLLLRQTLENQNQNSMVRKRVRV